MIGALALSWSVRRSQPRLVAAKDLAGLARTWSDTVVLTFPGGRQVVGKPAVRQWYAEWFNRMQRIECRARNVSVTRCYALGLTNTVLLEEELLEKPKNGPARRLHHVAALQFRRGKVTAIRVYVSDPDGEAVFSGLAGAATVPRPRSELSAG